MSQKIEYNRTKERHSDKIIFDVKSQTYKNRREFKTWGFDEILRVWNFISKREEILDVSTYPTNPSYVKDLFVLIKRTGLDPNSLKQITKYFKQKLTVKSLDKNILLNVFEGKLFQTNFGQMGSPSQPICLNGLLVERYHDACFNYLKVEASELEAISNVELAELLKQNYPLVEESFLTPDGSKSEYKNMV